MKGILTAGTDASLSLALVDTKDTRTGAGSAWQTSLLGAQNEVISVLDGGIFGRVDRVDRLSPCSLLFHGRTAGVNFRFDPCPDQTNKRPLHCSRLGSGSTAFFIFGA